jgi:hypothetical protein
MGGHSIATALTRVFPGDVARHVVSEMQVFLRRAVYTRPSLRQLATLEGRRVNIGCGDRPTPGWINLELRPSSNAHFWDYRRGLPFSDGAVAAIYSEHIFEHFDPDRQSCFCANAYAVDNLGVYSGSWSLMSAPTFRRTVTRGNRRPGHTMRSTREGFVFRPEISGGKSEFLEPLGGQTNASSEPNFDLL